MDGQRGAQSGATSRIGFLARAGCSGEDVEGHPATHPRKLPSCTLNPASVISALPSVCLAASPAVSQTQGGGVAHDSPLASFLDLRLQPAADESCQLPCKLAPLLAASLNPKGTLARAVPHLFLVPLTPRRYPPCGVTLKAATARGPSSKKKPLSTRGRQNAAPPASWTVPALHLKTQKQPSLIHARTLKMTRTPRLPTTQQPLGFTRVGRRQEPAFVGHSSGLRLPSHAFNASTIADVMHSFTGYGTKANFGMSRSADRVVATVSAWSADEFARNSGHRKCVKFWLAKSRLFSSLSPWEAIAMSLWLPSWTVSSKDFVLFGPSPSGVDESAGALAFLRSNGLGSDGTLTFTSSPTEITWIKASCPTRGGPSLVILSSATFDACVMPTVQRSTWRNMLRSLWIALCVRPRIILSRQSVPCVAVGSCSLSASSTALNSQ